MKQLQVHHTIPTKIKSTQNSEFGKGLCICLVKFAEHADESLWMPVMRAATLWHEKLKEDDEKLQEYGSDVQRHVEHFKSIYLKTHGNYEDAISSLVQMWFNGASDHLYEIEVPERWKDTPLGNKIKELQNFGWLIGHGFPERPKRFTYDDIITAMDMAREIAMEIDRFLGLEPDIGQH